MKSTKNVSIREFVNTAEDTQAFRLLNEAWITRFGHWKQKMF